MKPLFSQDEFNKAKGCDLLPLECEICNKKFFQMRKEIKRVLVHPELKNYLSCCSRSCACKKTVIKSGFHLQKEVLCEYCNINFKKNVSQIRTTKHNFCSSSCSALFLNSNKKFGCRRSKLEKYLEENLIILFPNLEFHFNRKDTVQSELDIYIPELKLAFEINGIFHYKPIYGEDKFLKTQLNDNQKIVKCKEKDIKLFVLDVSKMGHYTDKLAVEYLNQIKDIINQEI